MRWFALVFLLPCFPCATQQKHDTPEQPHLTCLSIIQVQPKTDSR